MNVNIEKGVLIVGASRIVFSNISFLGDYENKLYFSGDEQTWSISDIDEFGRITTYRRGDGYWSRYTFLENGWCYYENSEGCYELHQD